MKRDRLQVSVIIKTSSDIYKQKVMKRIIKAVRL